MMNNPAISPQTEMIKRIKSRPAWQSLLTILVVLGITLMIVYKLWTIHGRTRLDVPETSVLVQDKRGSGLYITIKLRCYYCDKEDYGPVWGNLMTDNKCQNAIMSECYANQTTPDRKTTQVVRLMKSCTNHCSCLDEIGWCKPKACQLPVRCCWSAVYCDNRHKS